MISLETGSPATCGICKRQTTISFVTDRTGGKAYDLACQHRNGYCETCDMLVPDRSETIQEVLPRCPNCSPEEIELEEDDE